MATSNQTRFGNTQEPYHPDTITAITGRMFRDHRLAVVVPAFNEARLIGTTLDNMPTAVDAIYVVDDASTDATAATAQASGDDRVRVIRHESNRGVGGAILTGYRTALADQMELVAVMAGDAQMHPDDLHVLVAALLDENADYAKGNRFAHPAARAMPLARRLGGRALALLTRWATGLDVHDTQCGFTVVRASCLRHVDLDDMWPRYGYPNDLLALLAAAKARIVEAPVRPVYATERSGVRPWHALAIATRIGRRWLAQRHARPA